MKTNRLFWLMILWAIMIAAQTLLVTPVSYIQILVIVSLLTIMMFFETKSNFLTFLATILLYGFGLTIYSIANDIFDDGQYQLIAAHLMLTIALLITWLIVHDVKKLLYQIKSMKIRIKQLEKFDFQTHSLSFDEFKDRGVFIETGMRRRGEKGQLLHLKMVNRIPITVKQSLQRIFITICLDTVRTEFDLVSAPSEYEIVILLQGTDQNGRDIVISRLKEAVKKELNFIDLPYTINALEVDGFERTLNQLIHDKGA